MKDGGGEKTFSPAAESYTLMNGDIDVVLPAEKVRQDEELAIGSSQEGFESKTFLGHPIWIGGTLLSLSLGRHRCTAPNTGELSPVSPGSTVQT